MICSITSSGLEMPPDQNSFQIASIFDFSSPVTNLRTVLAARRQPRGWYHTADLLAAADPCRRPSPGATRPLVATTHRTSAPGAPAPRRRRPGHRRARRSATRRRADHRRARRARHGLPLVTVRPDDDRHGEAGDTLRPAERTQTLRPPPLHGHRRAGGPGAQASLHVDADRSQSAAPRRRPNNRRCRRPTRRRAHPSRPRAATRSVGPSEGRVGVGEPLAMSPRPAAPSSASATA